MKIAIGADHRGYELKNKIAKDLQDMGHQIVDCGTHTDEPCDYPDIAYDVATAVSKGKADRGILICMSGIGMAITANKVQGIRAGLCHKKESAQLAREHNDTNVLVLSSKDALEPFMDIVKVWLDTKFEGGRHERRVNKIKSIEERELN